MTAIASLKPEQILVLLSINFLPKEALQAFFKALGSLKLQLRLLFKF